MLRKFLAVIAATTALVMATATFASADNTAVAIQKIATRSASHKIVFIRALVVCSPDTTSAKLSAQVQQVNPAGDVQTARGSVSLYNSFECTGEEENVRIPVRMPTGGYLWHKGAAAVRNVCFTTEDPSGEFTAFLKARTVYVK